MSYMMGKYFPDHCSPDEHPPGLVVNRLLTHRDIQYKLQLGQLEGTLIYKYIPRSL